MTPVRTNHPLSYFSSLPAPPSRQSFEICCGTSVFPSAANRREEAPAEGNPARALPRRPLRTTARRDGSARFQDVCTVQDAKLPGKSGTCSTREGPEGPGGSKGGRPRPPPPAAPGQSRQTGFRRGRLLLLLRRKPDLSRRKVGGKWRQGRCRPQHVPGAGTKLGRRKDKAARGVPGGPSPRAPFGHLI